MNDFFRWIAIGILAGLFVPGATADRLNVVASTPNLASVGEAVGGEQVRITSLASGTEDAHAVRMRPSFPRVLGRADVLIEGGAELEHGWLPQAVRASSNTRILPGREGNISASRDVELIDQPLGPIDRTAGHVHAAGNPHFMLDPINALRVARTIAERFKHLDPDSAEIYEENLGRFEEQLEERLEDWKARLEPYRGVRIVTYHENFDYFARRFGFEIIGEIEPQPGAEPTPRHVAGLIRRMRDEDAPMIWVETYRSRRTADRIADETGAEVLVLPEMVGATGDIQTYFDLIEHNVSAIVAAMERWKETTESE